MSNGAPQWRDLISSAMGAWQLGMTGGGHSSPPVIRVRRPWFEVAVRITKEFDLLGGSIAVSEGA